MRNLVSLAHREKRAISFLLQSQNEDGGIPAVFPGDSSGGWTTSEAIEAVLKSTWPIQEFIVPLEKMISYNLDTQFKSKDKNFGGWPFVTGAEIASTMATGHAIIALSMYRCLASDQTRNKIDEAISSATGWLIDNQEDETGGWGVEPGIEATGVRPRMVSTFLAVRALAKAGHRLQTSQPLSKGVNFIWSMQAGDGFRLGPDIDEPDVCSSTRAFSALQECGALEHRKSLVNSIYSFIRRKRPKGSDLWPLSTETYVKKGASGQIIFNHNSTAEILDFLAEQNIGHELQHELINWFLQNQRADGAWPLGANDLIRGDIVTWPTNEAILALSKVIRNTNFIEISHGGGTNEEKPSRRGISRKKHGITLTEKYPSYGIDVAILCALDDPELNAVRKLNWDWQEDKRPDLPDSRTYLRGNVLTAQGKQIEAVAVAAPHIGMAAMAVLAMKIIARYRPKYIITTGILASARPEPEINFGDVLIADCTWDYGSGKLASENGHSQLSPAPYQLNIDPVLANKFTKLGRDAAALGSIKADWQGAKPHASLAVHVGPVASGAAVVADSEVVASILGQHRKIIGLEMEAYSLFYAALHCPEPRPSPIAIKSVTDYGDRYKSNTYQTYASYTSARVLELLVKKYLFEI